MTIKDIIVGIAIGAVVTGIGYQIIVNQQYATSRAEVAGLKERIEKDEKELIGVKRFEEFSDSTNRRLEALEGKPYPAVIYRPLSKAPRLPGQKH